MKRDNIPGYPGHYLNRCGTLWRFKNGKWEKVKRYISPKGYPHVHLYSKGKSRIKRLNRLVATIYIPNPDNLPVVMHLDNNPLNNKVSNLKWGTYKENSQQMMKEGRNRGQFSSRLSLEQMREIVRLYDTGNYTLKELSIKFNCKNMSRLVRRTRERSALSAVGTKN